MWILFFLLFLHFRYKNAHSGITLLSEGGGKRAGVCRTELFADKNKNYNARRVFKVEEKRGGVENKLCCFLPIRVASFQTLARDGWIKRQEAAAAVAEIGSRARWFLNIAVALHPWICVFLGDRIVLFFLDKLLEKVHTSLQAAKNITNKTIL